MAGTPRAIVEDGVLTTWIMDWRSARQLGMAAPATPAAAPAARPGPAPTNLWLEPGTVTPRS
jgi:PmbA protein